jgi:N-acetyl-gamma-glutamyl-phosphate reductase
MGARATVLGASGYSGGELLRLLTGHPSIEVVAVAAARRAGLPLGAVQPHLAGVLDLPLTDSGVAVAEPAEVVFSCLPAGELAAHLDAADALTDVLIVDLADDHRADPAWTYGLTEFNRDALRAGAPVANPGCYPTAALLALVPFARAGVIGPPVVIDAMSGVSGAGRKSEDHLSFSVADGSATAYGSVEHRHVPEIERGLAAFGGLETGVSFTPHLVPFPRGLLVTARAALSRSIDDAAALDVLRSTYEGEPFVTPLEDWPATKAVAGSNRALVSARVDARNGWLVCSAAIDNLGKGAAGQALQNVNVALGLDERTGLDLVGVWP